MKKYINLLPPQEQNQNRLASINSELKVFAIWILSSLIVLALFLFAAEIFLQSRIELIEGEKLAKDIELKNLERTALREDIQILNQDLVNYKTLRTIDLAWSPILYEFGKLLPSDITVDSLVISHPQEDSSIKSIKVEAAGRAGTRKSVLQLRASLLVSEYFMNVNFPLVNLEKPLDVKWKYRFYVQLGKLQ